ncbi:8-oxo-dGTP pyrophosphatase MutT (NUDIX family) [Amycolatopsis bartoniae]|uniref:Nudix hydrolase domain-containing protein n=1 Tax=Amycolatopsis bartoniae TaxID=941986 RepID=A0A8H9MAM1_9PSEU|nr:hypothetical protein [Amycolatopsis bartoniae]MBB2936763.1 8-oxo-dGTP pyrophosphatase MutT (NUDIX family) [Amycolatopsis bartoniae]TVT09188.1 hypothetical protein FNH07_09830 [Amycolatopsis bartoniae]GHF49953.1 hypothetical protein GCM10017566_23770 [Amycolatopsis bartoniae]
MRKVVMLRVSLWRLWTFLRRRPWAIGLGVALLASDLFTPKNSAHLLLLAVTAIVVVKGLADVVWPAVKDLMTIFRVQSRPRPAPVLRPYSGVYKSWQRLVRGGDEAIHDPVLDAELADDVFIKIEHNSKLWLPGGEYEELRKLKVSTLHFDEYKARLESDLLPGGKSVRLQKTLYSAFLVTNRLASSEYRMRGSLQEYLSFDKIALDDRKRIPRFPLSTCSNHVGVDVLAICDGKLLLQRQGQAAMVNPGKIVASASGSADWGDAENVKDLLTFVRAAMAREMKEELGLSRQPASARIKVLGYSRLTSLAGKPQFYGIANIDPSKQKVKGLDHVFVDDYVVQQFDPDGGTRDLLKALDRVEKRYKDQLSFPLHITFCMVRQWLAREPAAAKWLGIAA